MNGYENITKISFDATRELSRLPFSVNQIQYLSIEFLSAEYLFCPVESLNL
ncbi:MAG: hypothetical protein LBB88_04210 [Planctomycetaceae bacterium]|nr:hypothetical protein [Planctomycetaceae bacterium]